MLESPMAGTDTNYARLRMPGRLQGFGAWLALHPRRLRVLCASEVEHLEWVVETARRLMTSHRERLLRRLHDLPREMAALAARLDRPDHAGRDAGDRGRACIGRVA